MSAQNKNRFVPVLLLAVIAIVCGTSTVAAAQDHPYKKWELYAGYSYLNSCAYVHAKNPGAVLPLTLCQEPSRFGVGGTLTRNFSSWGGLTLDSSGHWGGDDSGLGRLHHSNFYNVSLGPKLTFRREHFAPFVEALVGWHRLAPHAFGSDDRVGFIGGGGIDIPFSPRFAWRLARADYVISDHHFGPSSVVPTTHVRGYRLQSGIVFMFGNVTPPAPVSAACSITPAEVLPGEPVTATVAASNFNPNHTLTYDWSSNGGKANGKDTSATIDTNGLAAGNYTVTARVADPRWKKGGEATCSANFAVKELAKNPPTISCSANPSTIQPNGNSIITATASSPDGRPLTYSYTASAGSISGTSTTATLSTSGAASGPVTVTCSTQDDRGLSASNSTTVSIEAPPPPPPAAPQSSKLNQIDFKQNSPRVDNAAKAILDEVALRMQRDSDARVVLVGQSGPNEKGSKRLAEQRAVNTKTYLTKEKGIDANRIEVRSGNAGTMQTDIWLVPAGASFSNDGTATVNESAPRKKR